ncbi:MAG: leader peptide processing enzyme [Spirochaetota bacterium]
MNKKVNTLLFVLGATVFNIIMMIVILTVGLAVISAFAGESIGSGTAQILFLLLFVGSIAGAFFVYHQAIKLLSRKIEMEKYFHPIFTRFKK